MIFYIFLYIHLYFKSIFIINLDFPGDFLNLFSFLLFILGPTGNVGCLETVGLELFVLLPVRICDWSEFRCRMSIYTDPTHRLSFSLFLEFAY